MLSRGEGFLRETRIWSDFSPQTHLKGALRRKIVKIASQQARPHRSRHYMNNPGYEDTGKIFLPYGRLYCYDGRLFIGCCPGHCYNSLIIFSMMNGLARWLQLHLTWKTRIILALCFKAPVQSREGSQSFDPEDTGSCPAHGKLTLPGQKVKFGFKADHQPVDLPGFIRSNGLFNYSLTLRDSRKSSRLSRGLLFFLYIVHYSSVVV